MIFAMEYVITASLVIFATILLLVEVMLIPGIGFTGILGIMSMIGAIAYSFFFIGGLAGWITLGIACIICVAFFLWALYGKSLDRVALKKNIDSTVKEGEISMSITKYNQIFGTSYDSATSDSFVPHKVSISSYKLYDTHNENPLFTIEVTIAKLHSYSDVIIFNPENSNKYKQIIGSADTYPYALYLSGTEGVEKMLDTAYGLNYSVQGHTIDGIRTMTRAVEVFIPIFELMATILCTGAVLIILNFASKMITDKLHGIGILKALGAKNSTISTIFGLQVMLIAILTSVMSTLGYFIFIDLANTVLFKSLQRLAPLNVVLDLDFLTFKPIIAAINCVAIFLLSLIALLLPLIKIKLIKPVKIIKARD